MDGCVGGAKVIIYTASYRGSAAAIVDHGRGREIGRMVRATSSSARGSFMSRGAPHKVTSGVHCRYGPCGRCRVSGMSGCVCV